MECGEIESSRAADLQTGISVDDTYSKYELWLFVLMIVHKIILKCTGYNKADLLTNKLRKYVTNLSSEIIEALNQPDGFYPDYGRAEEVSQIFFQNLKDVFPSSNLRNACKDKSVFKLIFKETVRISIPQFLKKVEGEVDWFSKERRNSKNCELGSRWTLP